MKLFNAKLELQNVIPISVNQWQIDAILVDNSGAFMGFDVQAGDIVYATGQSQQTMEINTCRYQVVRVDSVSGVSLTCTVVWDEPGEDYSDPLLGMDTIIGRSLHNGLSTITTIDNGVGNSIISFARNIDLAVAKFVSGDPASNSNLIVKFTVVDINVRDILVGQKFIKNSELVTMNGLTLSEGEDCDYIITDNSIILSPEVELTVGDIFHIRCKPAV